MTAAEIRATREGYRAWFEASGRYPRIVWLMDAGVDPDEPATRDERFQFGLDCVLDGIVARLPARPLPDRATYRLPSEVKPWITPDAGGCRAAKRGSETCAALTPKWGS